MEPTNLESHTSDIDASIVDPGVPDVASDGYLPVTDAVDEAASAPIPDTTSDPSSEALRSPTSSGQPELQAADPHPVISKLKQRVQEWYNRNNEKVCEVGLRAYIRVVMWYFWLTNDCLDEARPLTSFGHIDTQMPTSQELPARLKRNLIEFRSNYIIITGFCLFMACFLSLPVIIGLIAVAGVGRLLYEAKLRRGDWLVIAQKYHIPLSFQMAIIAVISTPILIYCGLLSCIAQGLTSATALVMLHASFHKEAEEAVAKKED